MLRSTDYGLSRVIRVSMISKGLTTAPGRIVKVGDLCGWLQLFGGKRWYITLSWPKSSEGKLH